MLTSRRSPAVAAVRRLQAPSGRREAGAFIAEGPQAVREALAAGVVRELYATPSARTAHPELVAAAPVTTDVSDEVLEAMGETRAPQGLLAVCSPVVRTELDPEALAGGAVLLDRVGDPGNAGSIIRTADAAGTGMVVMARGCVDPQNGKVVRASAGSVFHVPIAVDIDPIEAMSAARAAGLVVAGTSGTADTDLADFVAGLDGRRVAWWLGSEAHGLDPSILAACDARVRIPIRGRAESLNVAAAAAVCLYAVPQGAPAGGPRDPGRSERMASWTAPSEGAAP